LSTGKRFLPYGGELGLARGEAPPGLLTAA